MFMKLELGVSKHCLEQRILVLISQRKFRQPALFSQFFGEINNLKESKAQSKFTCQGSRENHHDTDTDINLSPMLYSPVMRLLENK